jgi:DNA replicative helicase MCM subunit Mcm2 (Cdc46/Mcm family)
MMEFKRSYKCKSCSHAFDVKASIDQPHNGLVLPSVCPTSYVQSNDEEEKKCTSTTFEPIVITSGGAACQQSNNNGVQYTDYQEIKIQESAAGLEIGSIPRSLLIKIIHGDLVDSCQPGDEIFVVGNLMAHWEPLQANLDCHVHTILVAHSIRVINADDHSGWKGGSDNSSVREQFEREFDTFWDKNTAKYPIAARNFIVSAVCPKLYGMLVIKLALLLTLIGGSDASNSTIDVEHCDPTNTATRIPVDVNLHDDNDEPDQFYFGGPSLTSKKGSKRSNGGTTNSSFKSESRPSTLSASGNQSIQSRRRTQSHILLVGDPGTGKVRLSSRT